MAYGKWTDDERSRDAVIQHAARMLQQAARRLTATRPSIAGPVRRPVAQADLRAAKVAIDAAVARIESFLDDEKGT